MSESDDTRKCCRAMEARGALVFAVVGGMMQEPGWPDRYVAPPGAWLEFKALKGRLFPKQEWVLRQLARRGVAAYVARHTGLGTVDVESYDGKVLAANVRYEDLVDALSNVHATRNMT